jgi:uncharacterized protein YdeI (YjbR/CyaY-like superfamily)
MTAESEEHIPFPSAAAWETWLKAHQNQDDGIWMMIAKKGSGVESVNYSDAVDVALCYGWIDAQKRKLDETYFLQRFVQRRPRSAWSKVNVARVENLINAGRMRARGKREVEAAKADGRWDAAYHAASAGHIPPELEAALKQNAQARKAFDELDSVNRYAICYRVQAGKKPETRQRNVEKFIAMLERGERIHQ